MAIKNVIQPVPKDVLVPVEETRPTQVNPQPETLSQQPVGTQLADPTPEVTILGNPDYPQRENVQGGSPVYAQQEIDKAQQKAQKNTVRIAGQDFDHDFAASAVAEKLASKKVSILPDTKPDDGRILLASCKLKISKVGSTVPLNNVTPAEIMLLVADHHAEAGGNPVQDLQITGSVERSANDERQRLRGKYSPKKVNALFPGAIPQLPLTFKQAAQIGDSTVLPTERLVDYNIT